MTTKEMAALPVKATSAGVGVPEDLFRLVTEERREKIPYSRAANSLICSPAQILATWAFPNLQAPMEPPAHSCPSRAREANETKKN
jgi:hypothetical protein